jgi:dolichol-phosphate mannosyltransferase
MNALVIIPTYNEAATIATAVAAVLAAEPRAEVLVVDDASPDGTGGIVADLIAAQPDGHSRVHLLSRAEKDGLGPAYRAGFAWGLQRGYDVLVEMDADLSHPADRLPALLDAVTPSPHAGPPEARSSDGGADLAIGSRYVPGGATRNWSRLRELISRGGNLYVRLALGLGVRDATAGYRAYRKELLEALPLERMRSSGYCFQVEMVLSAWQQGWRVTEIPITFTERSAGRSKMSKKIVAEALWRVTVWALSGARRHRDHPPRSGQVMPPTSPPA